MNTSSSLVFICSLRFLSLSLLVSLSRSLSDSFWMGEKEDRKSFLIFSQKISPSSFTLISCLSIIILSFTCSSHQQYRLNKDSLLTFSFIFCSPFSPLLFTHTSSPAFVTFSLSLEMRRQLWLDWWIIRRWIVGKWSILLQRMREWVSEGEWESERDRETHREKNRRGETVIGVRERVSEMLLETEIGWKQEHNEEKERWRKEKEGERKRKKGRKSKLTRGRN